MHKITMKNITIAGLGACLMLCFLVLPAHSKGPEDAIKKSLYGVGQQMLQKAARNVHPSKADRAIKKVGNHFVGRYVEIDPTSLRTELRRGETPGHYVGLVKYDEHFYECKGASKKSVFDSQCIRVNSRRLTELIFFDGKWHY